MSTQDQAALAKISPKQMEDAIKNSGYLLEQRIEPIISKQGFFVQMNSAYRDSETGKSREVDLTSIAAIKVYRDEFLFPYIICECENNAQAVVFFTRYSPLSFLHHEDVRVSGIPVKFWNEKEKKFTGFSKFTEMGKFHHYCKDEVATQYCSFQLKKDKSSWMALHLEEQHDTFNSLIKALEYEIDRHFGNFTFPKKDEEEGLNVQVYYPLLILQGDLYTAKIKGGNLVLKKARHVMFRKEYFLATSNEVESYQIDVITEDYLRRYLKIVDSEMQQISKVLQRRRKDVRFTIDKIIQEARMEKIKNRKKTMRELLED
jgi:hypothetical protein